MKGIYCLDIHPSLIQGKVHIARLGNPTFYAIATLQPIANVFPGMMRKKGEAACGLAGMKPSLPRTGS